MGHCRPTSSRGVGSPGRNLRAGDGYHSPSGAVPDTQGFPNPEYEMRPGVFAGAAALAALLAAAAPGAAQDPAPRPGVPGMASTIRVSATGEVQVEPDRAWVDFGLENQGATAQAASEANAQVMERVIAALRRAGVPREQIETRDYSVFPDYAPGQPGESEPRIRGYRVSNVVTVRTDQVTGVGALIDAALAAGANRVHGVRFGLRDPQAARGRALRQAIERGRAEAETIAAGLGVRLGAVLDASTSTEPVRPFPMREMAMDMARAQMASAPTPIEAGQQTVTATISLVYAIVR